MEVYILVKKCAHSSKEEIEEWVKEDYRKDLHFNELVTNIGAYDNLEKAKEIAIEFLNKLENLHEESALKTIFEKPIRVLNSYVIGTISYKYLEDYYIVDYIIDKLFLEE